MILVVGCGFVGETVAKSLEEDGQTVVPLILNIMTIRLVII